MRLTARQQQALELLRHDGPLAAEELGAFLHSQRKTKRHRADLRCQWCRQDGYSMLTSLARKGLAKGVGRGRPRWVAVAPAQLELSEIAEPEPFPEGF
jgi:hypothetical protein